MKKYALVAVMAAMLLPADAQTTIGQVLADIESNNTTLKALRAEAEAQKLDNRTGMTLADPEVELVTIATPNELQPQGFQRIAAIRLCDSLWQEEGAGLTA